MNNFYDPLAESKVTIANRAAAQRAAHEQQQTQEAEELAAANELYKRSRLEKGQDNAADADLLGKYRAAIDEIHLRMQVRKELRGSYRSAEFADRWPKLYEELQQATQAQRLHELEIERSRQRAK